MLRQSLGRFRPPLQRGKRLRVPQARALHAAVGTSEGTQQPDDGLIDLGSVGFTPIAHAQSGLEWVHATTGLPWWCTIAATTITLKCIFTLPLSIYQAHIFARLELLRPDLDLFQQALREKYTILHRKGTLTNDEANTKLREEVRQS